MFQSKNKFLGSSLFIPPLRGNMKLTNKEWSDKLIAKIDPEFRHRWEVFKDMVADLLDSNKTWIDCGCGNNLLVKDLGHLAKRAYGIDISDENKDYNDFIKADIKKIPLPAGTVDLITLRFVVEHFKDPEKYFDEAARILKQNGKILILTTNLYSPIIFLPKFFFPFYIKNIILSRLFKIESKEIFPTYHKINNPEKFKQLKKGLKVREIKFISDLNYTRRWIFLILFFWHYLTKIFRLEKLRTNLLVILEKSI